jgi:YggT family protein
VNAGLCSLLGGLHTVIYIYILVLLVYAVLSWIPDLRGRWSDYVGMVVEPLLSPIRRIIPPAGGIDWSFLVLIVLLNVLARVVANYEIGACYLP